MPPGGEAQPEPRMRGRWRWARRAIACLFIGAAVNALVAWGCALWAKPTGPTIITKSVRDDVGEHDAAPELGEFSRRATDQKKGFGVTRVRHWGHNRPREGAGWVLVRSLGLPMRSMYIRWQYLRPQGGNVSQSSDGSLLSGIEIESQSQRFIIVGSDDTQDQIVGRRLPLAVHPLGFGVNSAIYGAGVFSVFAAFGWLRGWIRRRAGRCVCCGYDLATLPITIGRCPECGTRRTAQRAAA